MSTYIIFCKVLSICEDLLDNILTLKIKIFIRINLEWYYDILPKRQECFYLVLPVSF